MNKRKRIQFIVVIIIVVVLFLFLVISGFQSVLTYYYTADEFLSKSDSLQGQRVRVSGQVAENSVKQDLESQKIEFLLTDGKRTIPVVYIGVVPDTFKPGGDVIVEGMLDSQGVFQADTLLVACPAKYQSQKETSAVP